MNNNGVPLLGVALTHLHPGAGRTPGLVDLPVVRDNLGYPLVFAQSVKGALKTLCAKKYSLDLSAGQIKCDSSEDARLCCCLFGGEQGEGDKGAGAITVLDLIPLAFPVASADMGYLYVTSHTLLARASALAGAIQSKLKEVFNFILNNSKEAIVTGMLRAKVNTLYVMTTPLRLDKNIDPEALEKDLKATLDKLKETLGEIHPLAGELFERLLILDDSIATVIVDKALLRITRVRLDRSRKTVIRGGLWTEEYIPQGTVFLTGVIANNYLNKFCNGEAGVQPICKDGGECISKLMEKLELDKGLSVFIGGKESVGKGLIVFRAIE